MIEINEGEIIFFAFFSADHKIIRNEWKIHIYISKTKKKMEKGKRKRKKRKNKKIDFLSCHCK